MLYGGPKDFVHTFSSLGDFTTAVTAESFAAPVLDVFLTPCHGLKSQHVMGDSALEFGPPSGTGKLIPLLLDMGTSRCTRSPQKADGIFPHLTHATQVLQHRCDQ